MDCKNCTHYKACYMWKKEELNYIDSSNCKNYTKDEITHYNYYNGCPSGEIRCEWVEQDGRILGRKSFF